MNLRDNIAGKPVKTGSQPKPCEDDKAKEKSSGKAKGKA